jgi:hypothetical protein
MDTTRREFAVQLGGLAAGISLGEIVGSREAAAAAGSSDLSIEITGLCGLVHDRKRAMTEVLFIDTTVFGAQIPRHKPVLIANLRDVMNPSEDSKPTTIVAVPSATGSGVEQVGLWDLTDQQVSITRPGGSEAARGLRLNRPDGVDVSPIGLPKDVDDPQEWRDLRYIIEMEKLCGQGRVANALLSQDPGPDERVGQSEVPQVVAARLRLAEGVLEGAIPSRETYRGVMYKFPPAGNRPAFSQPVTDTVCWRLSTASTMGNYVAIDIVPLRERSGLKSRTLMIAQRGRPCRLSISNLPAENRSSGHAHHAMSDEEMGALHFGAYYKLLMNEPLDTPLPEVWRDRRRGVGLSASVLCPPAMFTRQ